jgi:hypothetical protein
MTSGDLLLNEDGQPYNRRINADGNFKKAINALCGACRGMLADGNVTEGEARTLRNMIYDAHLAAMETGMEKLPWPIPELTAAVDAAFEKNRIDEAGLEDLRVLMIKMVGEEDGAATSLPLCSPPPAVVFESRVFLLTGKFFYGSRKAVESITAATWQLHPPLPPF